MEWLALLVLIPAIIVPIVLLFGFSERAFARLCEADADCPAGTRCVEGRRAGGRAEFPSEALTASGISDSDVDLAWTTDDLTVSSFEVRRAEEVPGNGSRRRRHHRALVDGRIHPREHEFRGNRWLLMMFVGGNLLPSQVLMIPLRDLMTGLQLYDTRGGERAAGIPGRGAAPGPDRRSRLCPP